LFSNSKMRELLDDETVFKMCPQATKKEKQFVKQAKFHQSVITTFNREQQDLRNKPLLFTDAAHPENPFILNIAAPNMVYNESPEKRLDSIAATEQRTEDQRMQAIAEKEQAEMAEPGMTDSNAPVEKSGFGFEPGQTFHALNPYGVSNKTVATLYAGYGLAAAGLAGAYVFGNPFAPSSVLKAAPFEYLGADAMGVPFYGAPGTAIPAGAAASPVSSVGLASASIGSAAASNASPFSHHSIRHGTRFSNVLQFAADRAAASPASSTASNAAFSPIPYPTSFSPQTPAAMSPFRFESSLMS